MEARWTTHSRERIGPHTPANELHAEVVQCFLEVPYITDCSTQQVAQAGCIDPNDVGVDITCNRSLSGGALPWNRNLEYVTTTITESVINKQVRISQLSIMLRYCLVLCIHIYIVCKPSRY